MTVRFVLRALCTLGAVSLIGYGMLQPLEADVRWLICLWAAAPLIGLAAWLSLPPTPRNVSRNIANVGLSILVGFGMLSLQLLRQQVVLADAIYAHVVVNPDGSTSSNVRPVLDSQRILRGRMFDRKGEVLVGSEAVDAFGRRTYPLADRYDPAAFSNVVGFFSTRYGQSSLEATYAEYLTGQWGNEWERLRERFVGGTPQGNDLTLTLNAELQAQAAAALNGRTGSVVVLDPRTGAILALVSQPGFDPRQLSFDPGTSDWEAENLRVGHYWSELMTASAGQPLLNRPTQGLYPPGSIFKTVTAIGVLEHPEVGQPNTITCPETFKPEADAPPVVNAVPNLARLTGEPASLERVYAYSCNTAFAQYAIRLKPELLSETASRFDILPPQPQRSSSYSAFTDLPTAQSLSSVEADFLSYPRALADTGYGQGQLLVTPLQMALVAAAVAHDGVMMQPYLVQKVTRPDGGVILAHSPRAIRTTMSPETARIMRANMGAVAQYGFGKSVDDYTPPGILVGGKSGTAEHVPGQPPHAWFIAVAPLDAPRYAVAVMLERGGEGSHAGAELAGQVLAAAFATE